MADVIFLERFADDTLGSAPNNIPDLGNSANYSNDPGVNYVVFDNGGERGLRVSASTAYLISHSPIPFSNPASVTADFSQRILDSSSLAGANAFANHFNFGFGNNIELRWGNDQLLRVLNATNQTITTMNWDLNQTYFLHMDFDLVQDFFSITVNGNELAHNLPIGGDVFLTPEATYSMNLASTGSVEYGIFTMEGISSVPEPTLVPLFLVGFLASRYRRRNRS
ncbi:MAG: PEP-CTERM sorting domain-containing protein [Planctomycetales bacterium]|nr:PEP-CTERM sorting domain-containing protein [Planctomycetales bacterium]